MTKTSLLEGCGSSFKNKTRSWHYPTKFTHLLAKRNLSPLYLVHLVSFGPTNSDLKELLVKLMEMFHKNTCFLGILCYWWLQKCLIDLGNKKKVLEAINATSCKQRNGTRIHKSEICLGKQKLKTLLLCGLEKYLNVGQTVASTLLMSVLNC